MEFTLDKHGLWVNGIGRLMFAFAGIESAILALLKQVSLSKVHDTAAQLSLHSKIGLLLEVLSSVPGDHSPIVSSLESARRLSKQRNLVAHNRLAVRISVTQDLQLRFREFIPSSRNENVQITLEQLQDAAEKAEQVERALWSEVKANGVVT